MEHVLELVAVHRVTDRAVSLSGTIRAVAGGDRDAFARLYADYSRMVVTAYTRIRELREPEAFGGWIAAIARNRATDYLRQSREQIELPEELPGGDPIEAETFAVLDVIRGLPAAYRDTLLMRLVEGMSGQEIADRTGLAPGSVRVNLHRGMKLLREKLGPAEAGHYVPRGSP